MQLGVERIENLILVTGCTLVTSWGVAVCVDNNLKAEISLANGMLVDFGTRSVWGNVRGHVEYHNSPVRSRLMFCSACADYSFVIAWKGKLTDGSMRLYQGLPSKARPLWDQGNRHWKWQGRSTTLSTDASQATAVGSEKQRPT